MPSHSSESKVAEFQLHLPGPTLEVQEDTLYRIVPTHAGPMTNSTRYATLSGSLTRTGTPVLANTPTLPPFPHPDISAPRSAATSDKPGLTRSAPRPTATALENNMPLVSSNVKHFRPIKNLSFKTFHPGE